MYTVNNSFEIGEECWTVYKKKTQYTCPICEGKGHFTYNGYEIQCRNCGSTGKLTNSKQSVFDVCKAVVDRIDVAFYSDSSNKIKYRVHALEKGGYDLPVRNRSEKNLFKTREEAEVYCFEENTKEINIPLSMKERINAYDSRRIAAGSISADQEKSI